MLYIPAIDHARKLKFSSYVHLPSINEMFQYCYAWMIQCSVGEVIIFEPGCYISALEHIRMLILNVPLACVNTINMYGHAWLIWCLKDFMTCSARFNTQSKGSLFQLWNTVGI